MPAITFQTLSSNLIRNFNHGVLPGIDKFASKINDNIKFSHRLIAIARISSNESKGPASTTEPKNSAEDANTDILSKNHTSNTKSDATGTAQQTKQLDRFDDDSYDDYEEPKTAGQKVQITKMTSHSHLSNLNSLN